MNRAAYLPLALCCMAGAPGCTSPQHGATPALLARRIPPAPYTIAQLGYGDAAHFGLCIAPACPLVTPKHAASVGTRESGSSGDTAPIAAAEKPDFERRSSAVNVLTVYFAAGQSRLDAQARRSIDALVSSAPARRVQIAARTDSTGNYAQNGRVARERATTVARYLRTMPRLVGVPVDLEAKGLCCYVATNDDETGRRLNRRVDIALIPAEQQGAP